MEDTFQLTDTKHMPDRYPRISGNDFFIRFIKNEIKELPFSLIQNGQCAAPDNQKVIYNENNSFTVTTRTKPDKIIIIALGIAEIKVSNL